MSASIDAYTALLLALPGIGIPALVAYVISQNSSRKDEIHQLRLQQLQDKIELTNQIGGKYVDAGDFAEFRAEVKREMHQMRAVLYRLADKFGIPATLED